jgi:hypothetical protein
MGRSDPYIVPFYKQRIRPEGKVALLGFTNNNIFEGDLYDQQLGNWDINSEWELPQKYDTIICTRCAYFAKDVDDFIKRCYISLKDNGRLYVDFGLGDQWRYSEVVAPFVNHFEYKVGWVKDGEHEYAYAKDNYLWATVWDDSFSDHEQFKIFKERVKKFGYDNIKKAIHDEVPSVLSLNKMSKYFNDLAYDIIALWEDRPQMYIFISGVKEIE